MRLFIEFRFRFLRVRNSLKVHRSYLIPCVCARAHTRTCSVVSDSLGPYGLQPTRLLCPWNFPRRILEWGAMSSSRGSSQPRDWTRVSCIGRWIFHHWATGEAIWYPFPWRITCSNMLCFWVSVFWLWIFWASKHSDFNLYFHIFFSVWPCYYLLK